MAQQSHQSESIFDEPVVQITIVIMVVGILSIMFFTNNEETLSYGCMVFAKYALMPFHFILGLLRVDMPYYEILVEDGYPHKYDYALALLHKVFTWYSPLILGLMGWACVRSFTRNLLTLTSGPLSRDQIWAINAYNFTSTLPTFGREIERAPLHSGAWHLAESPSMYCAKRGVLEILENGRWSTYPFDLNKAGHLSRAPIKTADKYRIDNQRLESELLKDLGPRTKGYTALANSSPIYAALMAIFVSRIVLGKEFGYEMQDKINRCFVTIKDPTSVQPIPRITPNELSEKTLATFIEQNHIIEQVLEIIDFNQLRLRQLHSEVDALKAFREASLRGEDVVYEAPAVHDVLLEMNKKYGKYVQLNEKNDNNKKKKNVVRDETWASIEMETLLQRVNKLTDLDAIRKEHAYIYTLLYRLYVEATRGGVLTTSDFIWLRPLNQTLFFSLNNKGRDAAALIEGAAVHYHAKCEMRLGKAMAEPEFSLLVEGITREVNDFLKV